MHSGTLYVVSTPIGNLEDVTLRALRVLRESDVIAAEDTRHTRKLLAHYDIHTPLVSYHQHTDSDERKAAHAYRTTGETAADGALFGRTANLIARMTEGQSVALVTDAGTPIISDPGSVLVEAAIAAGIPVVPVPGASAILSALVASGVTAAHFVFEGFLPRGNSTRRAKLSSLAAERRTMVFYEAANRTAETLSVLADAFGPDRPCAVGRELTKRHEQFHRGTLGDVLVRYREGETRGEVTIVVGGSALPTTTPEATPATDEQALDVALRAALDTGLTERDAVRAVSAQFKKSRRDIYAAMLALKDTH